MRCDRPIFSLPVCHSVCLAVPLCIQSKTVNRTVHILSCGRNDFWSMSSLKLREETKSGVCVFFFNGFHVWVSLCLRAGCWGQICLGLFFSTRTSNIIFEVWRIFGCVFCFVLCQSSFASFGIWIKLAWFVIYFVWLWNWVHPPQVKKEKCFPGSWDSFVIFPVNLAASTKGRRPKDKKQEKESLASF